MSLYEASEQSMLKSVLYSESSRSWQVGVAPHFYTFMLDFIRTKQRKLQIEDVEAQTASVDKSSSDWDEDETQGLNISAIKARTSSLSKMSSSCPWMKYLKCFINCCIQRSNTLMRFLCAFHLLQMVAAFTCSEHFVALKRAVTHYQVLESEEILKKPVNLSSHLYTVGLWTESLKLINIIIWRLVCAHFTSLINEEKDLFLNRSQQNNLQSDCAIIKAIKAMMIKINSKMKEWNTSDNSAERSAFENVQCNLQKWRQEGAIWSLIQKRFSSLALLVLTPHYIWVLLTTQSILRFL